MLQRIFCKATPNTSAIIMVGHAVFRSEDYSHFAKDAHNKIKKILKIFSNYRIAKLDFDQFYTIHCTATKILKYREKLAIKMTFYQFITCNNCVSVVLKHI